jgi:hypothetical protein
MNRPADGMPTNVALFPRVVDPMAQPAQTGFGQFTAAGPFGSSYSPFDPSGRASSTRT